MVTGSRVLLKASAFSRQPEVAEWVRSALSRNEPKPPHWPSPSEQSSSINHLWRHEGYGPCCSQSPNTGKPKKTQTSCFIALLFSYEELLSPTQRNAHVFPPREFGLGSTFQGREFNAKLQFENVFRQNNPLFPGKRLCFPSGEPVSSLT